MNETIARKLKMLPDSPGCYLMKEQGKIIYVGKKQRERIFYYSAAPEISPRSRLPAIIIDIPFRIRFPGGGL